MTPLTFEILQSLLNVFVPEWNQYTYYEVGSGCKKNGVYYTSKDGHVNEDPEGTNGSTYWNTIDVTL